MKNLYTPELTRVKDITIETRDVKTLRLEFDEEKMREGFSFTPGQFVELSVPGVGEATFCLTSSPRAKGYIECSVKRIGKVTEAIHMLDEGSIVGIRGPYGNDFPIELMNGKSLIFVGGGIGLAALRSLILEVLAQRDQYGDISILYGARSVRDLVYKTELEQWQDRRDIETVLTVDPGGESEDWKGKIGFVPSVLEELSPPKSNSIVITCGPPIMIRYVLESLDKMGFDPENVITTLEMKMKCGLGHCGRCNIGPLYVCRDGPVFTYQQIKEFVEQIF
ncbi:FAD/NAD(P)-binding protein [Candidatus Poribacteria bacterium]